MAFSVGGGVAGPAGAPGAPGAPGAASVILHFLYTVYLTGGNWVAELDDGTIPITNADPTTTINAAIVAANAVGGGVVYVKNPNAKIALTSTILMLSNVTLFLDENVTLDQTGNDSTVFFNFGVTNSHLIGNGWAKLEGYTAGAQNCIYIFDATWCSVQNVEVVEAGTAGITVQRLESLLMRNVYIHGFAKNQTAHGLALNGVKDSRFDKVTVDGVDGGYEQAAFTRSGICIFGDHWDGRCERNLFTNITSRNSQIDNGIYLCGDYGYEPRYNVFDDIITQENDNTGHSGIKFRPAGYNTVKAWISINDFNGFEMGTSQSNGDKVHSEHNTIEGTIISPDNCGVILYTDFATTFVRHNVIKAIVKGAGSSGLWINTGTDGDSSIIEGNDLQMILEGNTANGAYVEVVSDNGKIKWNKLKLLLRNNGGTGLTLAGAHVGNIEDNYVEYISQNNTGVNVVDGGAVRTRFNGHGDEVKGSSGIPVNANWQIGDIVRNTNDNSVWIKDTGGTFRQLA